MTKEEIAELIEALPQGLDADDFIFRLVNWAVDKEREKVAKWMIERSYASGHGDTVEDLVKELEWQVAEREREACAKVVEADGLARGDEGLVLIKAAGRIRARGEK